MKHIVGNCEKTDVESAEAKIFQRKGYICVGWCLGDKCNESNGIQGPEVIVFYS